jgi:hypothetical protein
LTFRRGATAGSGTIRSLHSGTRFKALETFEEWYYDPPHPHRRSPRSVQYHLHKVFAKLDISSRAHRHRALPAHTKAA